MKLTERDKEVLDYIKGYMKENGTTPTMKNISEHINISTMVVQKHFQRLIELGYIKRLNEKSHNYIVKGMKYVEE